MLSTVARRSGRRIRQRDDGASAANWPFHCAGRSKSFCAEGQTGGWMGQDEPVTPVDAVGKARSFASWLMVTGQLTVYAECSDGGFVARRVAGSSARQPRVVCPPASGSVRGRATSRSNGTPWSKVTAMTGAAPDQIRREFERARAALVAAYMARGLRASGRGMTSVFHRLRLTFFHAGRVTTRRPMTPRTGVSHWLGGGHAGVRRRGASLRRPGRR